MADIDTVIQRYTLQNDYSDPAKSMIQTTLDLALVIQDAISIAGKMAQSFLDVGRQAVEAAAGLETTRTIMTALAGSAEKANTQLAFLRQLAKGSTLSFKDTQEAGRQLDEYGLSIQGFGRTVAQLAAVNPGQGISGITRLFGRIAEGGGLAKRQLVQFGLSLQDFQKQGIRFRGETLLSSSRETLEAFRNIVESKYGKVLDGMQDTTSVKLKNVRDAFNDTLIKVGDSLSTLLKPALDNLLVFLDKLQDSKAFETFLTNIAKNIVKFVGIVFGVLGTLLGIAALVAAAMGNVGSAILLAVASVAAFAGGAFFTIKTAQLLKDLTKQAKLPGLKNALPESSKDIGDTSERIAKNTAQTAINTARALDLKKFALGGGPLGELGVTPVEIYGRGGRDRAIQVNLTGAGDLERYFADKVQQIVQQMQKQGALG